MRIDNYRLVGRIFLGLGTAFLAIGVLLPLSTWIHYKADYSNTYYDARYLSYGIILITIGAILTAIGWTLARAPKEESAMEFEQKTSESEPVPTIREGLYWREVIMKIECPYCGFLYDETLNKCPQCGDRR